MHVSSVFVTEKSSRIFFPNTRNSPSARESWNPIKSSTIGSITTINHLIYHLKLSQKETFIFPRSFFEAKRRKERFNSWQLNFVIFGIVIDFNIGIVPLEKGANLDRTIRWPDFTPSRSWFLILFFAISTVNDVKELKISREMILNIPREIFCIIMLSDGEEKERQRIFW